MTAIQDEKEARKSGATDTEVPREIAKMRTLNNRYLMLIVLLILGQGIQSWLNVRAFNKAQNNKEIVYVKMFPEGTWHLGEFNPSDQQLYFRSTIDSLLETFAKSRYGQIPETIKRNYGEAGVFMSDAMMTDFISTQPGGFNAIQRAVDISADKNSDRIEVTWGFADHYERIPAVFDKKEGEVVRSNVYLTITRKSASGIVKSDGVQKKILRLQWHLLPKQQLAEKKMDWLRLNPIGLEIISAELIDDPAGNNSAPGGTAQ